MSAQPATSIDDPDGRAQALAERHQRLLITRQSTVLQSIIDFHSHPQLARSLQCVADGVRRRFGADRVSIGLVMPRGVTLGAISQQAVVSEHSSGTQLLLDAMEEAQALDARVVFPTAAGSRSAEPGVKTTRHSTVVQATPAHQALALGHPGLQIISLPMAHQTRCVSILSLECSGPWSAPKTELLHLVSDALAPMIHDRLEAERTVPQRLRDRHQRLWAWLSEPLHLVPKLAAVVVIATLALGSVVQVEHRVAVRAEVVPDALRNLSAPIAGYVDAVYAGVGDSLSAGDPILRLDTRELHLERERWQSELDRLKVELRATRASGDRRQLAMAEADRDLAASQLRLVEQRIERATLVAPEAGRIVSGDLTQLLGTPVERGQPLAGLATGSHYSVHLFADEADMSLLETGQSGTLSLTARPDQIHAITITRIHPMAVQDEGRTRFRLTAEPSGEGLELLPGQTGVARVNVGEAAWLSTVTRRFLTWARLQIWARWS